MFSVGISMNKDSMNFGKSFKQPKAKFSKEDDMRLIHLVRSMPHPDWFWISKQMINRNPRQCRERWFNYLDPSLHKGDWTDEEDAFLIEKYKEFGPHWNAIARFFNGRSGNGVRNRWLLIMRHNKKEPTPMEDEAHASVLETDTLQDSALEKVFDGFLLTKEKVDLFSLDDKRTEFVSSFM